MRFLPPFRTSQLRRARGTKLPPPPKRGTTTGPALHVAMIASVGAPPYGRQALATVRSALYFTRQKLHFHLCLGVLFFVGLGGVLGGVWWAPDPVINEMGSLSKWVTRFIFITGRCLRCGKFLGILFCFFWWDGLKKLDEQKHLVFVPE